jgi:ATP synthase F1 delta subunit
VSQRFARPYAKAFLASAGGLEESQKAQADLATFAETVRQVPEINRMAGNPAIPGEVKEQVLSQIADLLGTGPLTRRLLNVLVHNYRLVHLDDIVEAVDESLNRRMGVVTARVTCAQPLDSAQEQRLRAVLETRLQQKVRLDVTTEPGLLAGFVARIGSRRYDASLDGRLSRLATTLAREN